MHWDGTARQKQQALPQQMAHAFDKEHNVERPGCICEQSPWFEKAKVHHGGQCPLLTTFNRVRKGVNLRPIALTQNRFVASLQREPVKVETVTKDAEKGLKELRGEMATAIKWIVVLEKKAGIKCNTETLGQQSSTTPQEAEEGRERQGNREGW
jgi:hypothetical protein